MSCIIGDAWARMPIPAVTLMKRMPHSRKNCTVWIASFRLTLRSAIIARFDGVAVQPAGFQPARRPPSRRAPIIMIAEVDRAEGHHRVGHADAVHEEDVEIAGEKGASAEAHDRHSGSHAAAVGKPFHERTDRRDVAESAAHAADDAHPRNTSTGCSDRETDAADDQSRPKNSAAAVAAARGPRRSTHGPPNAALSPSSTSAVREGRVGRAEPPGLVGKQRQDRPVEGAPA